ncbi:MAG TPA: thioesterase family protein [Pyrinomonadaceae bacterium]|jgi:acyl-CoA thioester hydrolase
MTNLSITYRGTIYPWHCDHIGHMNVMWYTGKFDEASWHFLAGLGLTLKFLCEQNRLMAAVQQNTTYKRELLAGNIITIRSGILEMKEKTVRFFHEMRNEETGEVAALTELTGIYLDAETRKSTTFPENILKRGREIAAEYHQSQRAGNQSAANSTISFELAENNLLSAVSNKPANW